MSRIYTTKTPSLKATIADVRNLDAKKINLKGKDILEHIKENVPTIKHSQDTREAVTENDLWGQWAETKSDGTIIVHDNWVTNPNASNNTAWDSSIIKVEDNKAYVNDTTYRNIQTEMIKEGTNMFRYCPQLTSFNSDLSGLTDGICMFNDCPQLSEFSSNLSSLMNGRGMFEYCSQLTSFDSDLSSLMFSNYMFGECSNLTLFISDLPSLTNGSRMFYKCHKLKSFSSDRNDSPVNLSNLTNGDNMFYICSQLTSFNSDLPSLTYGGNMFYSCPLTSFTSDLHSLMDGSAMFNRCERLITFASDLPSLSNGSTMFYNTKLNSFSSDLSSLTNGGGMFSVCWNLESFSSDLSNLTGGNEMFKDCSKLTSFSSDLSSLMDGRSMFYRCSLDAESVMYIAYTIKDITAEKQLYTNGTIPYVTADENYKYSALKGFMEDGDYVYTYKTPNLYTAIISASNVGKLTLGINVSNNVDTIQQQLEDFAKAATFDSWADLKQAFVDKGWTVTWQYGGTATTITYDMRGERAIPCPIYTQLIEEEDKDHAEYCNEEGTKFYNIDWGHDVTNPQDFQQFDSLEDAMRAFNVFPKENIIVTEE